ncbi:hypothetical protein CRG98_020353 [Punica granatum]|uniref:Reverse transcriptase Ty1/copia-type domain-containing protein n=1 Tax=Punica granatum TaxID=22663 RepID=A0A2I0JTS5_PUNGR|nr:hypothetical protein CRG98_020353 [Punica granatum]
MPQTNQAPILMDTDKPVETLTQVENVTEPRRTSRVTRTPARYLNLHENVQKLFVHGDNDYRDDPSTYEEAMSNIDSFKWLEAMKSEIDSMSENQVWDLVDPLEGIVPIGNEWVFKRKIGADGKVETYKARLVAKGYCQRQGVDYEETFSPVAMLKSIRIMLAIAAHYDYEVWQMDVKTAFLNGHIEEDIFMDQPRGFESKDKSKVCKLKSSIYGLKQASRSWNRRFDEAVKSFGFIKNEDEPCVYKKASGSMIAFLVLYVDDILLIDVDDKKSISGYIFTCNGGAVSCKSSKQETTTNFTTEAEYIAAFDTVKDAVWIRKFVTELGVVPSISLLVELYCDNTGAIAHAKEPRSHQKSKHIERRYHIIREIIRRGNVAVQKVASADNVADPLTKAMMQQQLDKHLEKMGLRYCTEWL